jgi:hypothetical protein
LLDGFAKSDERDSAKRNAREALFPRPLREAAASFALGAAAATDAADAALLRAAVGSRPEAVEAPVRARLGLRALAVAETADDEVTALLRDLRASRLRRLALDFESELTKARWRLLGAALPRSLTEARFEGARAALLEGALASELARSGRLAVLELSACKLDDARAAPLGALLERLGGSVLELDLGCAREQSHRRGAPRARRPPTVDSTVAASPPSPRFVRRFNKLGGQSGALLAKAFQSMPLLQRLDLGCARACTRARGDRARRGGSALAGRSAEATERVCVASERARLWLGECTRATDLNLFPTAPRAAATSLARTAGRPWPTRCPSCATCVRSTSRTRAHATARVRVRGFARLSRSGRRSRRLPMHSSVCMYVRPPLRPSVRPSVRPLPLASRLLPPQVQSARATGWCGRRKGAASPAAAAHPLPLVRERDTPP